MANEFENDIQDEQSKLKQKLGQVGRSLKKVDLRGTIEKYPLYAIGVGFAAGAIVGLVRPKPRPGRISGAIISTLGLIGFRLVKEAAVRELGTYAKNYVLNRQQGGEEAGAQSFGAQSSDSAAGVRYTPAL